MARRTKDHIDPAILELARALGRQRARLDMAAEREAEAKGDHRRKPRKKVLKPRD